MNLEELVDSARRQFNDEPRLLAVTEHLEDWVHEPDVLRSTPLKAFAQLESLAAASHADADRFMAALAVPLEESMTFDLAPTVDALLTEIHREEPPSLWLRKRTSMTVGGDFEEYSCTLPELQRPIAGSVGLARFSAYRDGQARESGEEFSRTIWFEYFPDAYLGGIVR